MRAPAAREGNNRGLSTLTLRTRLRVRVCTLEKPKARAHTSETEGTRSCGASMTAAEDFVPPRPNGFGAPGGGGGSRSADCLGGLGGGVLGTVVDMTAAMGKVGFNVGKAGFDATMSVGEAGFNVTKGVTEAVANPLVELGASSLNAVSQAVGGNTARTYTTTRNHGEEQCAKLLADGRSAFASGDLNESMRLYERCVKAGGDSQLLEAKALAAKAVMEKAVVAMEEAAQLAAALEAARVACQEERPVAQAATILPEDVLPLSEEEYAKWSLEDKVDELRMHLPSRSSEELRRVVIENGGDVKKAMAAAQGQRSGH